MGRQRLGPQGRGRHLWAWEIGPPGIAVEEKQAGDKQHRGVVIGPQCSAHPEVIWVTGLIRGCCRLQRLLQVLNLPHWITPRVNGMNPIWVSEHAGVHVMLCKKEKSVKSQPKVSQLWLTKVLFF